MKGEVIGKGVRPSRGEDGEVGGVVRDRDVGRDDRVRGKRRGGENAIQARGPGPGGGGGVGDVVIGMSSLGGLVKAESKEKGGPEL